ncbi:cysteine dioxygenase type I domain-containing protein [Ditylenchus destructor]|nr:cysteine dioxygenase type I domain-containing protein [Ditylenchus destructor]
METLIVNIHKLFESQGSIDENDSDLIMLEKYKSNQRDWQKYTLFHPLEYTRNLVDAGNGQFNLIILCWGPGQFSQIHNHTDSHCFVKVLQGQLLETRYACPKAGDEGEPLVEIGSDIHPTNAITYISDQIGLHRMENNSHTDNAVTLHLYTPPLTHCHLFDLRTGKRDNSTASYHTEFGRRTNKKNAKF